MKADNSIKALIIDDEYDICFLLSRILHTNNLSANFVNSLKDGKELLEKAAPSVLFLDNHLPDGFGLDFISYVKAKYPTIKVVMVTAHDTNEDRQKALQQGADGFIPKPFSASQIKAAIEKINVA